MMLAEKTQLFTFVVEYQGNTLVEQVESGTPDDAIQTWLDVTSADIVFEDRSSSLLECSLIAGLQNAWCVIFRDDQEIFFLINIIATAK